MESKNPKKWRILVTVISVIIHTQKKKGEQKWKTENEVEEEAKEQNQHERKEQACQRYIESKYWKSVIKQYKNPIDYFADKRV